MDADNGDGERSHEPDWDAYRARVRDRVQRRLQAGLAAVIFAVAVLVVGSKLLQAPDYYPAGDIRNDVWFRFALGAFFLGIAGFVLVMSLVRLRRMD